MLWEVITRSNWGMTHGFLKIINIKGALKEKTNKISVLTIGVVYENRKIKASSQTAFPTWNGQRKIPHFYDVVRGMTTRYEAAMEGKRQILYKKKTSGNLALHHEALCQENSALWVVANQTPHYTSIPVKSINPQPSHPLVIPVILPHSEPPPLEVAKWGDPLPSSPLSHSQASSYSSTGHKDGDTNTLSISAKRKQMSSIQPHWTPNSTFRILDDMASMPFSIQILQHKAPKHFSMPKLDMYNGTIDPFDHLMHFR